MCIFVQFVEQNNMATLEIIKERIFLYKSYKHCHVDRHKSCKGDSDQLSGLREGSVFDFTYK